MPLTEDQKQDVARRLANGEDVELTFGGTDDLVSGEANLSVEGGTMEHVGGGHRPANDQVAVDAVLRNLAGRIADLEVQNAVLRAQLHG